MRNKDTHAIGKQGFLSLPPKALEIADGKPGSTVQTYLDGIKEGTMLSLEKIGDAGSVVSR